MKKLSILLMAAILLICFLLLYQSNVDNLHIL